MNNLISLEFNYYENSNDIERNDINYLIININKFNHYFVGGVNLLWKLWLTAIGVAAVCFTFFIVKEIQRDKMRGGKDVGKYLVAISYVILDANNNILMGVR